MFFFSFFYARNKDAILSQNHSRSQGGGLGDLGPLIEMPPMAKV